MKAEITVTKLSTGARLKVKGDLTVQCAGEFKEKLVELSVGQGQTMLSLREAGAIDISAIQLLVALNNRLKVEGRRLALDWPERAEVNQLLETTGIKRLFPQP
jgi:anti-anti-sigma factor